MATVTLTFKDPKKARQLLRKLGNNQGMVIKASMLDDMKGEGLFRSAKNLGKSLLKSKVGQDLVNKGINVAANKIAEKTGSELAGNLAQAGLQYGNQKAVGQGLLKNIARGAKRAAKTKLGQEVIKNIGQQAVNKIAEKSELAGNLAQVGLNQATSGKGVAKRSIKAKMDPAYELFLETQRKGILGGSFAPLGR